jgi:hypothetical protein
MHGVVAALVAAAEDGPTVRPSPLASVLFLFLLGATALLLWSFVRHLRRAQSNLGPARSVPAGPVGPDRAGGPDGPGEAEGDPR